MTGHREEYYDKDALIERLTAGLLSTDQRVVFLVGSPISAPEKLNESGVPSVEGIIDLIRSEFHEIAQSDQLEIAIRASENRYQAAFSFLLGRRGQHAANEVIKRAVWKARRPVATLDVNAYLPSDTTSDEACRALDTDFDGWVLPRGVAALGELLAGYPEKFGKAVLTTNFDPLIEVSIGKLGGNYFRTVLHRDGNLSQTEGNGCHVIHLHGYWYGADTLHTPRQLNQPRPRLKASLGALLKTKILVICGYGAWDDTFTEALLELVADDAAFPEIIWTFKSESQPAPPKLLEQLAPGIDRGRVALYRGVDCTSFFPELLQRWNSIEKPSVTVRPSPPSSRFRMYIPSTIAEDNKLEISNALIEGDDGDRPPLVDICVGRDAELRELAESKYSICFITGFGGQGKSTIAAQYFSYAQKNDLFDFFIWRDCKEEAERFENQIISIIERLSNRSVTSNELAKQKMEVLADLLIKQAGNRKLLLVFDNVDHYVDLEKNKLTGNANEFAECFNRNPAECRVIFTCRPFIDFKSSTAITQKIEGLTLEAAVSLFAKRGAAATKVEVEDAYNTTRGHAFWLDLLAAQVAKNTPNVHLHDLLDEIRSGEGEIPTATLRSIWNTLQDRQQLVLKTMAETVRPETDSRVGEFLKGHLNFNQVMRALRSLRGLNLIVIKPRPGASDVLELHPLVREFVRRTFPRAERMSFIEAIMQVYQIFMGQHKAEMSTARSFLILQHWTESAELYVEAGKYQDAFDSLYDVREAFENSAPPGEFARTARLLFKKIDWAKYNSYNKFDAVVRAYLMILVHLGREDECAWLLEKYQSTVVSKDARYVHLCDLYCYMYWFRGEYAKAIEWGQKGKDLVDRSNVDTKYSTSHNLALSQRDSGIIDPALQYFLHGVQLKTVIDPDELDDAKGGHYYGNIGRCLHLMGQIDPAIICYRKSAVLIERGSSRHLTNQGYIRKWIGELLIMKNDYCVAKAFLEAAKQKWIIVAPPLVVGIDSALDKIRDNASGCRFLSSEDSERFFVAWIYGREAEFVPENGHVH